jgi:hypothetical protein
MMSEMKKDLFVVEFIKSGPFRLLLLLIMIIVIGVHVSKCKARKVQMKEDVLYIQPKSKVK